MFSPRACPRRTTAFCTLKFQNSSSRMRASIGACLRTSTAYPGVPAPSMAWESAWPAITTIGRSLRTGSRPCQLPGMRVLGPSKGSGSDGLGQVPLTTAGVAGVAVVVSGSQFRPATIRSARSESFGSRGRSPAFARTSATRDSVVTAKLTEIRRRRTQLGNGIDLESDR